MNKDKSLIIFGFTGFVLFVALISGSVWYMSNWAHSEVRPTIASPVTEPIVAVRPVPNGPLGGDLGVGRPGETRPGEPGTLPGPGALPEPGTFPDPGTRLPDGHRPRVAIVIDDWGYDWAAADAFLAFPERLTVAVLPFLPNSETHARQALTAGHQVILHMPMEAQNQAIDIGPGGIRTSMNDEDIAARVAAALAHIPGVSGMNNHMGSLATGDPRLMRTVLRVVAERGMFFLDSYTAATTVGPDVARAMAVPHAVNQVFLDHVDTEEHVRGQIARLVRLAQERGQAVGIGHVRPNTYNALIGMLPELQAAGIEFVAVSELLRQPTPGEIAAARASAAISPVAIGTGTPKGASTSAPASVVTPAAANAVTPAVVTGTDTGIGAAPALGDTGEAATTPGPGEASGTGAGAGAEGIATGATDAIGVASDASNSAVSPAAAPTNAMDGDDAGGTDIPAPEADTKNASTGTDASEESAADTNTLDENTTSLETDAAAETEAIDAAEGTAVEPVGTHPTDISGVETVDEESVSESSF